MFKHYFEQIDNVAIWPIISLIIFFTFFVGLFIWISKIDKSYITEMSGLPFEGEPLPETQNPESHG